MTRGTALALITRLDINRELATAGRPITTADRYQTNDLWDRVYIEDTLLGGRQLTQAIRDYGSRS